MLVPPRRPQALLLGGLASCKPDNANAWCDTDGSRSSLHISPFVKASLCPRVRVHGVLCSGRSVLRLYPATMSQEPKRPRCNGCPRPRRRVPSPICAHDFVQVDANQRFEPCCLFRIGGHKRCCWTGSPHANRTTPMLGVIQMALAIPCAFCKSHKLVSACVSECMV